MIAVAPRVGRGATSSKRIAYTEEAERMDEGKLRTLVNLSSVVMILILAGAFVAIIRAGLQAAGH